MAEIEVKSISEVILIAIIPTIADQWFPYDQLVAWRSRFAVLQDCVMLWQIRSDWL